jgi:TolB protein
MLKSLRLFTIMAAVPLLAVLACEGEDIAGPTPETEMATAAATTSRIAFLVTKIVGDDEFEDVYTMIPDGSGVRRLTVNGNYYDLDWAPGATKLAAVKGSDIALVSLDGSPVRNLTNTPGIGEAGPVWSPDGSKIVYWTENYEIYVMNANGSGQRNLTRSTDDEWTPRWSPDGRKIVYIGGPRGNPTVRVMNADGSGQRSLTDGTSNWEMGPVWSPDGRQIAFTAARGGNVDVYVINPDGSGLKNASNHPSEDGGPIWSPNSTKIAFGSNRKGPSEIYLMGRYGGSKTNLTQTPAAAEDNPRGWSPGGARILYQIGSQIWVMNADGTNKKLIYRGGTHAVWSR